jgi:hypothetical protein
LINQFKSLFSRQLRQLKRLHSTNTLRLSLSHALLSERTSTTHQLSSILEVILSFSVRLLEESAMIHWLALNSLGLFIELLSALVVVALRSAWFLSEGSWIHSKLI